MNVTSPDLFDFNRKSQLRKSIIKSCSNYFDPDKIRDYDAPYYKNLVHVVKDKFLLKVGVKTEKCIAFCMFCIDHAIMEISSYFQTHNCYFKQDTMQISTLCNFAVLMYFGLFFVRYWMVF